MLKYRKIFTGKKCKNSCLYCPVSKDSPELVALEEITKVLSSEKPENVCFYGGDPLAREDLPKLIELARENGAARIKVETNGRRLADQGFLEELLAEGLWHFEIKLLGPDPRTHDALSGTNGSFAETIEGIKNLKQALIPALNKEPFLAIVFLLASENTGLLQAMMGAVLGYKPDRITVRYSDSRLSFRETESAVKNALEMATFNHTWAVAQNIPFCVLNGYEEHVTLPEDKESFTQSTPCKTCAHRFYCPGLPVGYFEHNGTDGLETVTKFTSSSDLREVYG